MGGLHCWKARTSAAHKNQTKEAMIPRYANQSSANNAISKYSTSAPIIWVPANSSLVVVTPSDSSASLHTPSPKSST